MSVTLTHRFPGLRRGATYKVLSFEIGAYMGVVETSVVVQVTDTRTKKVPLRYCSLHA